MIFLCGVGVDQPMTADAQRLLLTWQSRLMWAAGQLSREAQTICCPGNLWYVFIITFLNRKFVEQKKRNLTPIIIITTVLFTIILLLQTQCKRKHSNIAITDKYMNVFTHCRSMPRHHISSPRLQCVLMFMCSDPASEAHHLQACAVPGVNIRTGIHNHGGIGIRHGGGTWHPPLQYRAAPPGA